jgi:hypothetical protein
MTDDSYHAPEVWALSVSVRAKNFLIGEGCRSRAEVMAFLSGPKWREYAVQTPNCGTKTIAELQVLASEASV